VYFLNIPAKNLGRRPTRSGLTGLGIAMAVASLIMLVGLARGLESAWSQSLLDRGVHILATQKGAVEVLAGAVNQKIVADLGNQPGVEAAAGELVALMALDQDRTVLAAGWLPGDYLWETLNLIAGKLPISDDQVVLGESLAAAYDLKPGDKIDLMGRKFFVAGISRNQSALNQGGVFLPLEPMQDLVGKSGTVTFVNLRVKDESNQAGLKKMLKQLALAQPGLEFLPTGEVTRQNRILGIFRAMSWGTSLLAIIISTIFVLNTMVMSVSERTKEIGILSAVGWDKTRIMSMIIMEGVMLSILGGLTGIALGVGGLDLLASKTEVGTFIQPRISASALLEAGGAAVLLGALGSLYPAWRAVNMRTAQALKRE
jgi:putative ABC transport system permease protein